MHPAPAFHWTDRDELLAFVRERAFATLFADRMVAHVPLIVDGDTCLLHLSRGNPLANALPVRVTAVVLGPDAYVSPDWYAAEDQVPTWNYVAVELEGELAEADVRDIVIRQSAEFEGRIAGKRPAAHRRAARDAEAVAEQVGGGSCGGDPCARGERA